MSSPISEIQLIANQANAQLSTGPASPEGKAASAQNNFRHGLSAVTSADTFQVLPNEDQEAYCQLLSDYRAEWKPQTATEHTLVNSMVMHEWLRLRALRLQESLFNAADCQLTDMKRFELFRRYETQHERSYNRAIAQIKSLRAFQARQENGFESQQRRAEEHTLKMRRLKQKEETVEIGILDKLAKVNQKIAKTFSSAGCDESRQVAQATAKIYNDFLTARKAA